MEKDNNPMVKIVSATLGIFMVVAIMFLIFAKDSLYILVPLAWAFVVLGILVAVFQYRLLSEQKGKKK